MTARIDLAADLHTHTTTSDGIAGVAEMLTRAEQVGLRVVAITDHVRADTTWVPEYVREVAAASSGSGVDVVCGVEAKLLDTRGRLDLPGNLRGIAQVTAADHQFPTARGPLHPVAVRRMVGTGLVPAEDAVADLVRATARAVFAHDRVVVGHLFSVLPKAGLDPALVTAEMLDELASACRAAGAAVEVNEKWRTPSPDVVRRLADLGVEIVAASDAHTTAALGAWDYVSGVAQAVPVG
jgi:putative hydrolase